MKSIQNQFIIDIFYKKLCCLFSKILSITFIFRNRQIMMLLFSCRIYNKYVCRQIGQITINVMNEYQIWSLLLMEQIVKPVKAELPQEDILFRTQFPSLGFFINKKGGFRKTKTTKCTTFKTDIIKVILVFQITNFFTNKKSQGRKLSVVQPQQFSFRCFIYFEILSARQVGCQKKCYIMATI